MFQMSWNTMMEGFKRHEQQTGQNPMEMAKQQNDAIKQQIRSVIGEEDFEKKLEELKKANEAKEKEIEAKKREIRDRKNYYKENAPNYIRQKIPETFNETEERFEELDD